MKHYLKEYLSHLSDKGHIIIYVVLVVTIFILTFSLVTRTDSDETILINEINLSQERRLVAE
jgi:flagellar biosynthesis/type III secretory pathway M-ring protein FliF/YscJ